jgi:hypothetical protein
MITVNTLLKIFAHIESQAKIKELILNITDFISQHTSPVSIALFGTTEKYAMKLFHTFLWFSLLMTGIHGWMPAIIQFYLFCHGKATEDIYVMPFNMK